MTTTEATTVKHTPGPWKASPLGRIYAPGYGWEGAEIAHVQFKALDTKTFDTLQTEANAHLIAAAPEMLGLLKKLKAHLEGDLIYTDDDPVADIDELIAKAEVRG